MLDNSNQTLNRFVNIFAALTFYRNTQLINLHSHICVTRPHHTSPKPKPQKHSPGRKSQTKQVEASDQSPVSYPALFLMLTKRRPDQLWKP